VFGCIPPPALTELPEPLPEALPVCEELPPPWLEEPDEPLPESPQPASRLADTAAHASSDNAFFTFFFIITASFKI